MVSREDCVATINLVLKNSKTGHVNTNLLLTLFEYLCDVMEVPHKKEAMDFVIDNSHMLLFLYPGIVEGLSRHFNICKVQDQDNKLITVY
jgi:hypothetical protein